MNKVRPMNKIKFIAKKFAIGLIAYLCTASFGWSETYNSDNLMTVSSALLKERIENLPSQVDLRYTSEVHEIITSYIKTYRRGSESLLGLGETYFPIYESQLQRQGLPIELKYLSVVESNLRPKVVSHAGAVGLWQFMKETGRIYGLTINSVVDERRDAHRSTAAATEYLKDLYTEFGDWTLAIAGYNCGAGGVKKSQETQRQEWILEYAQLFSQRDQEIHT